MIPGSRWIALAALAGLLVTPLTATTEEREIVAFANRAEELARGGDSVAAARHLREGALRAQHAGLRRHVAALLHRAGGLLLAADLNQEAVGAFEAGLGALAEDPGFDLASTFASLARSEKGFSAPPLAVPLDLYTSRGATDLLAEAGDPLLPARLLMGIGNAYLAQPQPGPATTNYLEALAIDGLDTAPLLEAMILTNLAAAHQAERRTAEAESAFLQSLALFATVGQPLASRRAESGLGALSLARRDFATARERYQTALALHRRADDELGRARALVGLGRSHAGLQQPGRARRAFAGALTIADRLGDRETQLHAAAGLGEALYAAGRLDAAREHLESAARLADEHQANLRTDEGKVAFLEQMAVPYDRLLRILLARAEGDPELWREALVLSEKLRGRASAQTIGARRRVPRPAHHRELRESARVSRQAPVLLDSPAPPQALDGDVPGAPDPPFAQTAGPPGIESLEPDPLEGPPQHAGGTEISAIGNIAQMPVPGPDSSAELEPSYREEPEVAQGPPPSGIPLEDIPGLDVVFDPEVGPPSPTADPSQTADATPVNRIWPEVGRRRRSTDMDQDADHAASQPWETPSRPVDPLPRLSFHVLEDRTAVFAVTREGEIRGHVAPFGNDELTRRIRHLRDALGIDTALRGIRCGAEPMERPRPDRRIRDELLRRLWGELVAPVADALPGDGSVLAVLPHGPLWLLPFAALEDEEGRWLGDRWPTVFAVSRITLDTLRGQEPGIDPERLRVLAVGDPLIAPALTDGEFCFQQLPGAAREALDVATLAAAEPTRAPPTLLLGAEADPETLIEALSQHDVVHLATHGVASESDPLDSFLLVAPGRPGAGAATVGKLTARRVSRELAVPAELVVLSACQTGMGRLSGEGVLGLGRAFLVAGARSVIVSLWSVSDQATAELMTAFYREYLDGRSKAEALQVAMREVRNQRRWQSPAFWAPFVLMGAED